MSSYKFSINLREVIYKNLVDYCKIEKIDIGVTTSVLLQSALNYQIKSRIYEEFGDLLSFPFKKVLDSMKIEYSEKDGKLINEDFTVDVEKNLFSTATVSDYDLVDFIAWHCDFTLLKAGAFLYNIIQNPNFIESISKKS